jgi:Flp pilus assembly protein TadD
MTDLFFRSPARFIAAAVVTTFLVGCASTNNVPGPALPSTGWTDSMMKSFKGQAAKTASATANLGDSLQKSAKNFVNNGKQYSIPSSSVARRSPKQRREQGQNLSIAVARTLERQGKTDQAIKAYQQTIDSGLKDATAFHRLAVLYDKKGEYKKANKMYHEAIALAPHHPEILADLGYSFYLQRRYAEAEEALRSALEYDADLPRARNNLAMVLASSEHLDDSFAEFRRAGADITDAHVNLAYVRMWRGDLQSAQEEFEMALAIDGSCRPAREGLARLESMASRKTIERHASRPLQRPVTSSQLAAGQRATGQRATNRSARTSEREPDTKTEVASFTSEWPRKKAY